MKSEIVYRIYHPSKALIWNAEGNEIWICGYWSEDDAFVVEFGNTDEEYEAAKVLAAKVGGVVEEVKR